MEVEHIKLRVNKTLINIYRRSTTYFASVYGQLPIPFKEDDSLEQASLIDLFILITLTYCKGLYPLEIFNEETKEWSNF